MKNFNKSAIVVKSLVTFCLLSQSYFFFALADEPKIINEIASEINSPFCKGKLLRDCPSQGASNLKQKIRDLVDKGYQKDQIIKELYQEYGDEIRAVPENNLIGLLGWLAPFGFITMVFVFLAVWIRRNILRGDQPKKF